jgi:hypothetical protein
VRKKILASYSSIGSVRLEGHDQDLYSRNLELYSSNREMHFISQRSAPVSPMKQLTPRERLPGNSREYLKDSSFATSNSYKITNEMPNF